jgi:hypothetical protein
MKRQISTGLLDDPTPRVRVKNVALRQIELGVLEPGDEVWVTYEARDRVRLANEQTGHISRGDGYAAGELLKRMARGRSVNPWLLLD